MGVLTYQHPLLDRGGSLFLRVSGCMLLSGTRDDNDNVTTVLSLRAVTGKRECCPFEESARRPCICNAASILDFEDMHFVGIQVKIFVVIKSFKDSAMRSISFDKSFRHV